MNERTKEPENQRTREPKGDILNQLQLQPFGFAKSLVFWFSGILVFCLAACSPYRFALQKNTGWDIEGRILKNKEQVDVADNNHLVITDSARVAIRCVQITDGGFDSELRFDGAEKLLLQFRTTPFEDSVNHRGGFSILMSEMQTVLSSDDTTIATPVLLPTKAPFRLIVNQHGNYFDVEVACANVGRIHTTEPSTQWIIASVPEGGTVHFIDPKFRPVTWEE